MKNKKKNSFSASAFRYILTRIVKSTSYHKFYDEISYEKAVVKYNIFINRKIDTIIKCNYRYNYDSGYKLNILKHFF